MSILVYDTSEMIEVVAGLVKQGLTFKVRRDSNAANGWVITLTGGY